MIYSLALSRGPRCTFARVILVSSKRTRKLFRSLQCLACLVSLRPIMLASLGLKINTLWYFIIRSVLERYRKWWMYECLYKLETRCGTSALPRWIPVMSSWKISFTQKMPTTCHHFLLHVYIGTRFFLANTSVYSKSTTPWV